MSAAYYSKQSLRILVVDRNPLPEQGRKTVSGWICGDDNNEEEEEEEQRDL
jgi:digeranylgeranylglycerophospholipid reductase